MKLSRNNIKLDFKFSVVIYVRPFDSKHPEKLHQIKLVIANTIVTFKDQSSAWGLWTLWKRLSGVYVALATVSRWRSRCRIHVTYFYIRLSHYQLKTAIFTLLPFYCPSYGRGNSNTSYFQQGPWHFLMPQHQSMVLYLMDFVRAHRLRCRYRSHYRSQSHSAVNVDICCGWWAASRCVWQN